MLDERLALADLGEGAKRTAGCGKAPRNWGKNVSLVCAIDAEEVKPSMSVEGAVDGKAFEAYVERFLIPTLKHGGRSW